MGFEAVTWEEINPKADILPEGDTTFQIQGGAADDKNPRTVLVKLAVIGTGQRHTERFFDPKSAREEWQGKATLKDFRRLQLTIGIEPMAAAEENRWGIFGEDPVDYLNRAAQQNATFTVPIVHKPSKNDPDTKFANVRWSGLKVAAGAFTA